MGIELLLAINPIILILGFYFINKSNKDNKVLSDRIIVLETTQNANDREFEEIRAELKEIRRDIKILIKRGD